MAPGRGGLAGAQTQEGTRWSREHCRVLRLTVVLALSVLARRPGPLPGTGRGQHSDSPRAHCSSGPLCIMGPLGTESTLGPSSQKKARLPSSYRFHVTPWWATGVWESPSTQIRCPGLEGGPTAPLKTAPQENAARWMTQLTPPGI